MAIQKAVRIGSWIVSDGVTTQFTIKLAKDGDPYWVGEAQDGNVRGSRAMNWFVDNPLCPAPKGVRVIEGALSATLAVPTSILTVTIQPAPNGTLQQIVFDLLFS